MVLQQVSVIAAGEHQQEWGAVLCDFTLISWWMTEEMELTDTDESCNGSDKEPRISATK